MADRLWDLCDALVTAINGQSWTKSFTAAVDVLPVVELTDGDLHVLVLPSSDSAEVIAREAASAVVQTRWGVNIIVQQKVEHSTMAVDVKALSLLCAAIQEYLTDNGVELDDCKAWCTGIERDPAYSLSELSQLHEFFAVLQTTWIGMA